MRPRIGRLRPSARPFTTPENRKDESPMSTEQTWTLDLHTGELDDRRRKPGAPIAAGCRVDLGMVRPIDDEAKKFGWLTLEVTEVRGDQLAGRVVDCAPWLQVEAGISLGHEM